MAITPCTQEAALRSTFPTIINCEEGSVKGEISGLIPDECGRNADQEGIALAPDEYINWRDSSADTVDARDYWVAECQNAITPCASLDKLLTMFKTIRSCSRNFIQRDIATLQEEVECSRSVSWDGILLAQEFLLRNSPDAELPTVWHHNDPTVLTAADVLIEKCEELIETCATKDELYIGFETINYCDENYILRDLTGLQGEECRRTNQEDGVLITPADRRVWRDNNAETLDSRTLMMHDCSERAKPSFALSELEAEFVEIGQCDWNTIRRTVGTSQPDSARRSAHEDSIFFAGEVVKAQDTSGKPALITTAQNGLLTQLKDENEEFTYYSMSFKNEDGTVNPSTILTDHCNSLIQTCVSDLAAFDDGFKTILRCDSTRILNLIEDHQKEGCSRTTTQDAPLIAKKYELLANPNVEPPAFEWGGNVPELNAYLYLENKCLEKIEPCVPDAELDFSDVLICDHARIEDLIRASQAPGCERNARQDARVIVRELTGTTSLLPWFSKDPTVDTASKRLLEMCHAEVESCVDEYAALNFEDIHYCDDGKILAEVTANQNEECTRHVKNDAIMMVREKVIADTGSAATNYVWRDGNDATPNAADYLTEDCKSSIEACSEIEDLDFENIRGCHPNFIKAEIREKQEGCSSDRNEIYDGLIMTDTANWNDAIDILQLTCEEKITPCLNLDTIDFSDINGCDDRNLLGLIDESRAAMGDACPSYGSRTNQEEAMLMTNTAIWNDRKDDTLDAQDVLYNTCMAKVESCTLRGGGELEVNGCDWINFKKSVNQAIRGDDTCNRSPDFELHALDRELREKTGQGTKDWIDSQCAAAWLTVEHSTFAEVDPEFDDAFMEQYIDGKTHLNLETGNFQGNCVYGRNDEIGSNIAAFKMEKAHETQMEGFGSLQQCSGQAIMCCFGRDRQFGDNNGNCAIESKGGCEDADPADNSNLCKTETQVYPNDDPPENDIHCHGLAWGEDENDFSRQLIFNNFFFVSLYDHMYSRGYVERTIPNDPADFGMCDCLENMPPVTRSDCTEVAVNPFIIARSNDGTAITATRPERLDVEFNSCRGIGRSNDLSTHLRKLAREERIEESYLEDQAWKVLVGYENPNNNNNEAACQAIL